MCLPISGNIIVAKVSFSGKLIINHETRKLYLNGYLLTEWVHFYIRPKIHESEEIVFVEEDEEDFELE